MDKRSVVVLKDSDEENVNKPIYLSDGEDIYGDLMDKSTGKIPFFNLDTSPSPTKRPRLEGHIKSQIQKAPDGAEDGEILSSPEFDPADIEIKIHADMTSSSEEDDENSTAEESPKLKLKLESKVTKIESKVVSKVEKASAKEDTKIEVIQVLDTPPEKKKNEDSFPQRLLPVQKKRLIASTNEDEAIEVDHLQINAPLQNEAKKGKIKRTDKNSPKKSKVLTPEKEKIRTKSPRDDLDRKRGYEIHDERRSRSDTEYEERQRRDKRTEEPDDLRKHLLKKIGSEHKSREQQQQGRSREHQDKTRDNNKGNRSEHSLTDHRQRVDIDKKKRSKDTETVKNIEPNLSIQVNKSRDSSNSNNNNRDNENRNRNRDTQDRSRDTKNKERDTTEHKKEKKEKKDKSKRNDENKSKKKKKRKHKGSGSDASPLRTSSQEESNPEKSPPPPKTSPNISPTVQKDTDKELSYDDISSESSVVEERTPPASPVPQEKSPLSERSLSRSPSRSLSRTPSRSPTPERSPTPVRKRSYYPGIEGCRHVEEFEWLNRIEEGTYGVVYRARDLRSSEVVALKRLKMEKEREGFPITSLREINTLLKAQHPNIVTVREIVVGNNMDKIYIVMDYVEHDLKSLMETMTQPFLVGEVKTLMLQLLRGVRHMHDNWILHRDIKASNLLLSHKGILKIGDFGLAREYGSPLKKYTSIVVTLWYRAPELLLGTKEYSTAIDLWSVGCVFAELLTMKPLFPGKSEIDQINRIFKELGTPNDKIWPGPPSYTEMPQVKKMNIADHPYNSLRNRFGATFTDRGFELLNRLLTYDPARRISSEEALQHGYFQESPQPVDPSMFPTWPAKSELKHRAVKKNASPKPPEGGQFSSQMGEDGGFHLSSTLKGSSAKSAGFNLKF